MDIDKLPRGCEPRISCELPTSIHSVLFPIEALCDQSVAVGLDMRLEVSMDRLGW